MTTSHRATVAVVDEDHQTREDMLRILTRQGHAAVGFGGMAAIARSPVFHAADLVVLAPSTGDAALAVCRRNGAAGGPAVVMLVQDDHPDACARGLEAGADDCLCTPCNPLELAARIRAVLRRISPRQEPPSRLPDRLAFAGWALDIHTRALVSPAGAPVHLTGGEFDLLMAFLQRPQQLLRREQLIARTRVRSKGNAEKAINVQLCRLRHRLGDPRDGSGLIQTFRGDGYLFRARVEAL